MQSGDQVVGFPIALQQGFDSLVLDADLHFEKLVLAFQALDIGCCDRSRLQTLRSAFGGKAAMKGGTIRIRASAIGIE